MVLVVSTARMARRRNLAVLRNWGNCVTTFMVVSTARMAGTRNLAVFLKKKG
ncbi:hypothetical protein [Eubacterium xylanophilum]|uniref:hypothetical protein n=1 Tax=Eubacterium xylanophilum TaxID=39497 RepID=UPI0004AF1F05|nr:hypothetical protein [Eubacterium xylanophilum]